VIGNRAIADVVLASSASYRALPDDHWILEELDVMLHKSQHGLNVKPNDNPQLPGHRWLVPRNRTEEEVLQGRREPPVGADRFLRPGEAPYGHSPDWWAAVFRQGAAGLGGHGVEDGVVGSSSRFAGRWLPSCRTVTAYSRWCRHLCLAPYDLAGGSQGSSLVRMAGLKARSMSHSGNDKYGTGTPMIVVPLPHGCDSRTVHLSPLGC